MQNALILLPLLELAAALAAGILVMSFVLTYVYGLETARKNRAFKENCTGFAEYQDAYDRHRFYRWVFLGAFVLAIVVIESMVRIVEVSFELTALKVIHYGLDAIFFVLLVLVLFPYNGKRNPSSHGRLVPWLAGAGLGVLVTGGYLYVQFCLTH
jgi:hypothetical protein